MLALDDAAMVRVLIAATAIEPERLDEWLQDVASRMERAAGPSPAARRQRRYRQRQRDGRRILPIAIDECSVANALIAARVLTEDEALDPRRVADALTVQIDGWAKSYNSRDA